MYGRRLSKADPRVDAYGCVDELNAALGLARSIASDNFLSDQILAAQKDLIVVMGELATAPSTTNVMSKMAFISRQQRWWIGSLRSFSILRKINRFIRKTGSSPAEPGFRGFGFCSHDMPPGRASHRCIQRRRKRFQSRDLALSESAFGSLLDPRELRGKTCAAFQLAAYCCEAPWIALQSGIKNWQPSGSRFLPEMLCMARMKLLSVLAAFLFCVSSANGA